jgi:hypothetical protein
VTLHPSPETPAWTRCSQPGHIDELRVRLDDALAHPHDLGAQERLRETASGLLEHLDGLHQDACTVWSLTLPEPDEPPTDPTGIDCLERFEGVSR